MLDVTNIMLNVTNVRLNVENIAAKSFKHVLRQTAIALMTDDAVACKCII